MKPDFDRVSDALLYLAQAAAPDHGTKKLRAALLEAIPLDADADLVAFVVDPVKGEDTRYQLVKDLRRTIVAPVIAAVRDDLPDGVQLHGPDAMTPAEQQAARTRYLELVEGWPDSPAWQEGRRVLTLDPEHGWTECSLEIPGQPWDPATVEALATQPAKATERHGNTLSSWDAAVLDAWAQLRTDDRPAERAEAWARRWADGSWLDRWVSQDGKPPKWLVGAALAYWRGPGKRLAANQRRVHRHAAGLAHPVHVAAGNILVDATVHGAFLVEKDNPARQLPLLPAVDGATFESIPVHSLKRLTSQRLVRKLIQAAHEGHFIGVHGPFQLSTLDGVSATSNAHGVDLEITGGCQALAKLIGATSKKAAVEVREALDTLSAVSLQWEHPAGFGGGSLITFTEDKAAPGRPAVLHILVSSVLCPHVSNRLTGHSRLIVPVLDVPPMPSRMSPRSCAALARFDWLATRAMVEQSREALVYGGVTINVPKLAERAGLTPKTQKHAYTAIEYWTEIDRWERYGEARYFLADGPDTRLARSFILDGGKRRERQSKRGQRSANQQRKKHRQD